MSETGAPVQECSCIIPESLEKFYKSAEIMSSISLALIALSIILYVAFFKYKPAFNQGFGIFLSYSIFMLLTVLAIIAQSYLTPEPLNNPDHKDTINKKVIPGALAILFMMVAGGLLVSFHMKFKQAKVTVPELGKKPRQTFLLLLFTGISLLVSIFLQIGTIVAYVIPSV